VGQWQQVFETLVFNPLSVPGGVSETKAIKVPTFLDINLHKLRDCVEGLNNGKEDNLTDSHIRYHVITGV